MARVEINEGSLDSYVRARMFARAEVALSLYNRRQRQHDSPGDPFAKGPGPRRSSIQHIPNGVRIIVESPGAEFFEEGNGEEGDFIEAAPGKHLWLRLKHPDGRGLAFREKLRIQLGKDGKPYLVVKRVRSYEGRHALRKSVLEAFGLTPF